MRNPTNYDDLLDRIDDWSDAADTGHELLGRELLYETWRAVEALTARLDATHSDIRRMCLGWSPDVGPPARWWPRDPVDLNDHEPMSPAEAAEIRAATADPTPQTETP